MPMSGGKRNHEDVSDTMPERVRLRGFEIEGNWEAAGGSVLGSGSFGVVVKATRISDHEAVALKIMACVAGDESRSVESAQKEQAALNVISPAAESHPNIAHLKAWHELDPTDDEVALAGPLMQGLEAWMVAERRIDPKRPMPRHMTSPGNTKICIAALQLVGEMELFDHLTSTRNAGMRFTAEFLRTVTKQLVGALKHVHSKGFGHFDLKLENIRIAFPPETDPVVTLVDFGLAVVPQAGRGPEYGQIPKKGTEGILPPESFTGSMAHVGTAFDIFSLGIVLFSLGFGAPPWTRAKRNGEQDKYGQPCAIDKHERGFGKYADLGEPGRLLAYVKGTAPFKVRLSPPAPAPPAPHAQPEPTPMATAPTLPKEDDASPAPTAGALALPTAQVGGVPAPSDPRLIDLLSKMLRIDPVDRYTAQQILDHDWITNPVAPGDPVVVEDSPIGFANCGASDAEPSFTSCGATAPVFRSLDDTELVLPMPTRTHALVAIEEGWAFAE